VGNTKSFFPPEADLPPQADPQGRSLWHDTTDYTDSTDCFKQYTNAVFLRRKHILYQKRPYVQEPNIIDYPCKSV